MNDRPFHMPDSYYEPPEVCEWCHGRGFLFVDPECLDAGECITGYSCQVPCYCQPAEPDPDRLRDEEWDRRFADE